MSTPFCLFQNTFEHDRAPSVLTIMRTCGQLPFDQFCTLLINRMLVPPCTSLSRHADAAWYCEWSDVARKAFLNDLLATVVPPDPLASLLCGLGVDATGGMPSTPTEQLRWAATEEEQVRVAALWTGSWPDHLKNELLNQLEDFDRVRARAARVSFVSFPSTIVSWQWGANGNRAPSLCLCPAIFFPCLRCAVSWCAGAAFDMGPVIFG